MKILICIGRLYMGGIEKYAIDLALGLQRAGYNVSVLVFYNIKNEAKRQLLLEKGVSVIELRLNSGHDFKLPFRFFNAIFKIKPDIIHLNILPLLGFIPLFFFKKPTVATIHQMQFKKIINSLYDAVLDGIIAVSNSVKEINFKTGESFLKNDWRVIYNGIDLQKQRIIFPNKETITLIMVGRIARDKNPHDAIEILQYLNVNSLLQYNLILMGDPDTNSQDYFEHCINRVDKYGLRDKVELTGWQEDVDLYMREAHGLLLLSDTESFGYAAAEAFAHGMPVFSYRIPGGLHEFHQNNITGVVEDKRNPAELAKKIDYVFMNYNEWDRFSNNALNMSKNLSVDKMVDHTKQFYYDLQNKNNRILL